MTETPQTLILTLPDGAGPRLDKALTDAAPEAAALSRSRLQALIADGRVSRGGQVVTDPKARVSGGEVWTVILPPLEPVAASPEDIPLDIRFEDAHLLVVMKPAGLVVHPGPGSETGTLVNALLHHCAGSLSGIGGAARPGIVHRIDKDTSGLLVVAKTDAAHHGLSDQFAAHDAEREYLALTWGAPSAADPRLAGLPGVTFEPGGVIRIDLPLARHPTDRKRMAVARSGGRRAVTRVACREAFGPPERPLAALVACRLETGRTHQIRVHLAHVGHPLMGDPVYAARRASTAAALPGPVQAALAALPGQALHARVLGFRHPVTGQSLRFEADLPEAFNNLLTRLRETCEPG